MARRFLRYRAAWHEIRCAECRASWRGWLRRLILGDKPAPKRRYPTREDCEDCDASGRGNCCMGDEVWRDGRPA
jgi:hypothetical protein